MNRAGLFHYIESLHKREKRFNKTNSKILNFSGTKREHENANSKLQFCFAMFSLKTASHDKTYTNNS